MIPPSLRAVGLGLTILLFAVIGLSPASAQSDTIHVVQVGETLFFLAGRYGVSVDAIVRANSLGSDVIVIGQRLRIPLGSAQSSGSRIAGSHTVQAGETISSIAQAYGVRSADLISANAIADPHLIRIGTVLRIPGSSVSASPSTPPPPAATPSAATYTVRPGDTLSGIADRHGLTTTRLAQLNGITDLSLVRTGQVLRLAETGQATPASATPGTYVVQAGDTLSSIAQRLGTTVRVLQELNSLTSADRIRVGERLRVPATGPAVAPAAPAPAPTPAPRPTATPAPLPAPSPAQSGEPYDVTFYCLAGRMANGEPVHAGAAAADASVHPFGTVIEVEGLGRFTIKDRYGRDENRKRIDIWTPDCAAAIAWGIRQRNAVVVSTPGR